MQLQEKHPDRVHAISLNVEYSHDDQMPPTTLQDKVKSMLKRLDITCKNMMCNGALTDTVSQLEVGGLPAVLVYVDGKLARRFDSKFSYTKDVLPFVDELVTR
jgi:hypothetical protein